MVPVSTLKCKYIPANRQGSPMNFRRGGVGEGGGCDEPVTHPISRSTFYPICIVI